MLTEYVKSINNVRINKRGEIYIVETPTREVILTTTELSQALKVARETKKYTTRKSYKVTQVVKVESTTTVIANSKEEALKQAEEFDFGDESLIRDTKIYYKIHKINKVR